VLSKKALTPLETYVPSPGGLTVGGKPITVQLPGGTQKTITVVPQDISLAQPSNIQEIPQQASVSETGISFR